MDANEVREPEGAPERPRDTGAGAPSGVGATAPQRFSAARKMAAVARLLRGEPMEVVARELDVTVARLGEWRGRALAGAATAMKERERDERDEEIARLKAEVGEVTMDDELLRERISALEGHRPSGRRRSRR